MDGLVDQCPRTERGQLTKTFDYPYQDKAIIILWSHYEMGESGESCDNQEYIRC